MQSGNKVIIKNTIFLYLRMIVVLGISLYTTRAVLAALGVEDFGIFNVVGGFVTMFAFLSNMMSNSTLRFYNNKIGTVGEDGISSVFCIAVVLQLVFYIIILLLLESFGLWYINNKLVIPSERIRTANWIFQFAIASMFFSMMEVPYKASILAHERMDFFSIISISDAAIKLVIVYLLYAIDIDSLWLYGFFLMLVSMMNLLANFAFCKIHYPQMRFGRRLDKNLFLEMSSFLGWSTVGNFSFMLKEQGVNLVLNAFFGPVVNAARGITMQVISALQQFVTNNNMAVSPQMAQSYARGEYSRSVSLFTTVSKLNFILFFIVALPIGLEINYILDIWLDGLVPDHTANFVTLVLLCYIINNWNSPLSNLFYATGQLRRYQLASFIILAIVPVVYIAFCLGASPEWAFLLTFFISSIHHFVGLLILRHYLPFSIREYIVELVLPSILVVLLSPIIPIILRHFIEESFGRLVIITIVSIIIVAVLSYYLILSDAERQLVIVAVKRKICSKK